MRVRASNKWITTSAYGLLVMTFVLVVARNVVTWQSQQYLTFKLYLKLVYCYAADTRRAKIVNNALARALIVHLVAL